MAFTVPLGLAIAGGAASVAGARQQNDAIQRSMNSQVNAATRQKQQLQDSAAVERQKIERRKQQMEGRIRVRAGEAGIGIEGGTTQALLRQADFDEGFNLGLLDRNLKNQFAAVDTGLEANLARLEAEETNPLLAAFTGVLGGLDAGLSIVGAARELDELRNTDIPEGFESVTPPRLPTL